MDLRVASVAAIRGLELGHSMLAFGVRSFAVRARAHSLPLVLTHGSSMSFGRPDFPPTNSRVCANRHGLIRKYGLNICRQCFQLYHKDIGFTKFR